MDSDKLLIESLPATSSVTIRKLKSLGINTYFDLLNYFPYRYENYSIISPIIKVQPEETVTVIGKIVEAKNHYTRRGLTIQRVIIADETGKIEVNWFNQPYLIRLFIIGQRISVAGIVKQFGSKLTIEPKEYEISGVNIHTGRLIPLYSEKKGLSSRTIREKVYTILNLTAGVKYRVAETLPNEIITFNNLIDENMSYRQIHFPDNVVYGEKARTRLSFDELFYLQLANNLIKKQWKKKKVKNVLVSKKDFLQSIQQFKVNLPFILTSDQEKVIKEIISDLNKLEPMNRFLQGDVGSGKTVVAAIACYFSFLNGYQSVIMAPTEILAQQHYESFKKLFDWDGIKPSPTITLITGSNKKQIVQTGHASSLQNNIIIGTHALLNKNLKFKKIGLVIIDEQHRFGVTQRAVLKEKALNPHLLTMTATPIPRTVALTLYGELDLSYIKEMPKGRLPIKTYLVPKIKRDDGYSWIKKQIKEKRAQVFIVCPLIEESESETLKSIKAAKVEFENLKQIFSDFNLDMLHGKIKSLEKERIMLDFKNKKIDILVCTPVVEVGIDIPSATIMIIEGAERFGLAQLHQLRGRIGRSNIQSYCFLFTENRTEKTSKRLAFFSKNQLGVRLAEYDLLNRGAGNIFGIQQHGFVNLKIASLSDYELIEKTKNAVEYFVKKHDVRDWKELKQRIDKQNAKEISKD